MYDSYHPFLSKTELDATSLVDAKMAALAIGQEANAPRLPAEIWDIVFQHATQRKRPVRLHHRPEELSKCYPQEILSNLLEAYVRHNIFEIPSTLKDHRLVRDTNDERWFSHIRNLQLRILWTKNFCNHHNEAGNHGYLRIRLSIMKGRVEAHLLNQGYYLRGVDGLSDEQQAQIERAVKGAIDPDFDGNFRGLGLVRLAQDLVQSQKRGVMKFLDLKTCELRTTRDVHKFGTVHTYHMTGCTC